MATKLSDEGTQSSNPSSSYANIVLNLKGERITENNKENIHDMNQSLKSAEISKETVDVTVAAEPATVTTTTINPPVPKNVPDKIKIISDKNKNENQEAELSEVEDDSSFTPVVSHSRREKKDKRKDKVKGNKGPGRESRRSRDRKEKREKKQPNDVQSENATATKSSSDENQEETEDGPKVFVEAPIPKVNAWKVSLLILNFHITLLFI